MNKNKPPIQAHSQTVTSRVWFDSNDSLWKCQLTFRERRACKWYGRPVVVDVVSVKNSTHTLFMKKVRRVVAQHIAIFWT